MSELVFRIHEVKCIDETGGNWLAERGDDDIYLAAVTLDPTKNVQKIPAEKVGGFSDGDVKRYNPPMEFVTFNLNDGAFPQRCAVNLVLIEKDSGKNIDPFLDKLTAEVRGAVAKADQATGGAPPGDPNWWKIVFDVGWEIGKEIWKHARKDDIFPPQEADVMVKRQGFLWPGNQNNSQDSSLVYKAHNATYRVTYDWMLRWS